MIQSKPGHIYTVSKIMKQPNPHMHISFKFYVVYMQNQLSVILDSTMYSISIHTPVSKASYWRMSFLQKVKMY